MNNNSASISVPETIKLIIALGNPGKEYAKTWHNAGFIVANKVKEILGPDFTITNKKDYELTEFKKPELKILKPLTYMNNSGEVVAHFLRQSNLNPDEILIIHDDLDIQFGEFKLQKGKFPKVHNGLSSIHNSTGEKDFYYLRVGIETRQGIERQRISGHDYVLQKIPKEKLDQFEVVASSLFTGVNKG